jgi:cytochrome c-type biogenesis protein CcmH/NrfG
MKHFLITIFLVLALSSFGAKTTATVNTQTAELTQMQSEYRELQKENERISRENDSLRNHAAAQQQSNMLRKQIDTKSIWMVVALVALVLGLLFITKEYQQPKKE